MSSILFLSKKAFSWVKTFVSKVLERKESLEIGLKLDKAERSIRFFDEWFYNCMFTIFKHYTRGHKGYSQAEKGKGHSIHGLISWF